MKRQRRSHVSIPLSLFGFQNRISSGLKDRDGKGFGHYKGEGGSIRRRRGVGHGQGASSGWSQNGWVQS